MNASRWNRTARVVPALAVALIGPLFVAGTPVRVVTPGGESMRACVTDSGRTGR